MRQFQQPLLLLFLIQIITQVPFSHCCHDSERNALLTFKSFLTDPSNRLLSWQVGKNCCNWEGIHCSKSDDSFHVVSVDLRNRNPDPNGLMDKSLYGAISPSFFNLSHLQYLDLSYNNFNFSKISNQFANLKHLTHLDLSYTFSGSISTQFVNLSSLSYLDVSCPDDDFVSGGYVSSTDTSWLRGLANLKELRLMGVDLNSPNPIQLANLTSLSILDFTNCRLQAGSLPDLPPQLKEIYMANNPNLDISLGLISNLSQLEWIKLGGNNITGQIPSSMSNLKNLIVLSLSENNLQGPIPESLCEISSLESLDLGTNKLTETIPSCILKLGSLNLLDVSKNSIGGTVSLISLINTSNLTTVRLNTNRIIVEINQQHPPLPSKLHQLEFLHLGRCNIKGYIPGYFCNLTNLQWLSLYRNNITGTIPSCLPNLQNLKVLDLLSNNLEGTIPHSSLLFSNMTSLATLDLSSNNLQGHVPLPPQPCRVFDVSKNKFTGGISTEVGDKLSNMQYVSLSYNELSGSIPSSICSSDGAILGHLDLSNNKLHGTIPSSIQYCKYLISLNLGYNKFSGSIPTFIGSLYNLKILYLRSNKFNGLIPKEITYLHKLQILDLSTNNLSGPIPKEIGYLKMLASIPNNRSLIHRNEMYRKDVGLQLRMVIKGTMILVERLYNYNSVIDLSCNNLEGNIPVEMCLLRGLPVLNLSHNCLSGKIPMRVGNMTGLQSLDLSFNKLSGEIPESLATIDSLGYLNLSYNNLSGRIPKGFHLETLSGDNGSTYFGNPLVCGVPTNNSCPANGSVPNDEDDEDEDASENRLLCGIVFLGFGVGFWGLFLVLLIKKETWWFGYWRAVDNIAARITECIR